jgi:hypothetical protein
MSAAVRVVPVNQQQQHSTMGGTSAIAPSQLRIMKLKLGYRAMPTDWTKKKKITPS